MVQSCLWQTGHYDWFLAAAVAHYGGGAARWSANCVEILIRETAEVHGTFEPRWAETSAILLYVLTSQWSTAW